MTILLIGKDGQLGESLYRLLASSDHSVLFPDRNEFDLLNIEQMREYINRHQPEVVFNTAAYNDLGAAEIDPTMALAINTTAAWQLAQICAQSGSRFVTYSTDYVFDGTKGLPYAEVDQPNPLQMYGISKYAGELAVRNANSEAVIIRTCGVFGGKTGSPVKGNFVLYILEQAKTQTSLEVGSHQSVNPTWSDDLAKGSWQLLQAKPAGGMYHLVNEGSCSWAEFASAITAAAGVALEIIPVDKSSEPGMLRPKYSALANTRASALGVILPDWNKAVTDYIKTLK